jgi:peptide/nickel transport system permease protein
MALEDERHQLPVNPAGVATSAFATDESEHVQPMDEAGLPEDVEDLPEGAAPPARSQIQLVARRFFRHKLAVAALIVLISFYLLAFFAPQIAPYDLTPELTGETLAEARKGPTAKHWFGTDELGRDQLTRVLYAGRVSLVIGVMVALISTAIGTTIGALAGYLGGRVDRALMFLTDLTLIVPGLAVLMIAQKGLGGSTRTIILILSFLFWTTIARVIRGVFLSLKEKEFVEAAKAIGCSTPRIIFRHMLPNTVGPIIVNTTLIIGGAILIESTLSFLGFGVEPPDVSWGNMIAQSKNTVGTDTAYLIYFPGLALFFTILAVNFLGDGLRDALDPQSDR